MVLEGLSSLFISGKNRIGLIHLGDIGLRCRFYFIVVPVKLILIYLKINRQFLSVLQQILNAIFTFSLFVQGVFGGPHTLIFCVLI